MSLHEAALRAIRRSARDVAHTARVDLTDDEAFDLTVSVAAGQLDAAGIEQRLRLIVVSDGAV